MDPRHGLLSVLATVFANGIPEIERRVGILRIEPIWDEEELPIVLVDFENEQKEIRTVAPRDYMHTLSINVVVYCKGESEHARVTLLQLIGAIEALMQEWQFILASDVDPGAATDDFKLIEEIRAGGSIDYFKSTAGNEDHLAARLSYEAEFYTGGASRGLIREGAPNRNRLVEFEEIMTAWSTKHPAGARAADRYFVYGEKNASKAQPRRRRRKIRR